MNSFFGFVLSEHELPLTLRFARKRRPVLSAASDYDVGNLLIRLNHAAKLRRAKRYLWLRGLVPYWDRDPNTRFRQSRRG
jgi:hypothetical protein